MNLKQIYKLIMAVRFLISAILVGLEISTNRNIIADIPVSEYKTFECLSQLNSNNSITLYNCSATKSGVPGLVCLTEIQSNLTFLDQKQYEQYLFPNAEFLQTNLKGYLPWYYWLGLLNPIVELLNIFIFDPAKEKLEIYFLNAHILDEILRVLLEIISLDLVMYIIALMITRNYELLIFDQDCIYVTSVPYSDVDYSFFLQKGFLFNRKIEVILGIFIVISVIFHTLVYGNNYCKCLRNECGKMVFLILVLMLGLFYWICAAKYSLTISIKTDDPNIKILFQLMVAEFIWALGKVAAKIIYEIYKSKLRKSEHHKNYSDPNARATTQI